MQVALGSAALQTGAGVQWWLLSSSVMTALGHVLNQTKAGPTPATQDVQHGSARQQWQLGSPVIAETNKQKTCHQCVKCFLPGNVAPTLRATAVAAEGT